MNITASYRGYDGSIIHDEEDQLFHGRLLGIPDIVIYHGDTPGEAEGMFREAVDSYLAGFGDQGRQPPQPFASMPSYVPHELRVKAALFAQEHETDIDNVLNLALANLVDKAA